MAGHFDRRTEGRSEFSIDGFRCEQGSGREEHCSQRSGCRFEVEAKRYHNGGGWKARFDSTAIEECDPLEKNRIGGNARRAPSRFATARQKHQSGTEARRVVR